MKLYYEEQLAYLAKSKEYCDNEIEELKWSVEKGREQCEEASNRLKQSNQQILQLNEDLLISAEKLKRSEDEAKDLQNTTATLRKEISELEQKERSLNEQLKTKGDAIYDLQKKLQNSESELFIVREKLRQTEAAYEERRTSDEKTLKEREKALGQKGDDVTQLQLELMTLKEELASATQENTFKGNEVNYLKDSLQTAKQDIANRDIKTEEVREQLKLSTQCVETLTKEHEALGKAHEEEKKNSAKLKKEWED
jgi:chromosome segregation ATPase